MLRKATIEDKPVIYKIWKESFVNDDNGYTDYYFDNLFECDNTYVIEEDNQIVSTLQRNKHQMMFNGKIINTSMILGVTTIPAYRKQGHMHELMKFIISQIEKEELFTLIQAYEPKLYKPYGFQMVYYRNRTTYTREQIPQYNNFKIAENVKSDELFKVYTEFTKKFNGYYVRSAGYYKNLYKEVNAEKGRIVGYRNENNELEGYMVYYLKGDICDIREIVYLNSWAFIGLVSYGATKRKNVCVHTSNYEKILKMIPGGSVKEYPFTMVRINDYALFNIYYDQTIQNPEEAMLAGGIPLFLHEYA